MSLLDPMPQAKARTEPTILLYHGVTASPSRGIENFSGKHIEAGLFERQMSWLAENANPMTLREMAARLSEGANLPERSVAVTFDDAFKNVHDVARPILRRHEIPATFFISTGFVGRRRNIWTDSLEHAVNKASAPALSLLVAGKERRFDISGNAARIAAVVALKSEMKRMSRIARNDLLDRVRQAAGACDFDDECPNYRNLEWDDVRRLDDPPRYEVGGHSVNHEILAYLDDEEMAGEIDECLKTLEFQLGHRIDLFSYPEGQAEHYDERVIARLKKLGVTLCPSAIDGVNPPGSDPFHLKRRMVGFMGAPFPFAAADL